MGYKTVATVRRHPFILKLRTYVHTLSTSSTSLNFADLSTFKLLCVEGRRQMESLQYQSAVVDQLSSIVEEAEMCERVAIHLLSYETAENSDRKPK